MAYEVITLNLIPSGEVPVIHAAQFDKKRPLMFALKLGDDDFDPSGYELELQIRKVDNNIVTAAPASTSGNVVTFNSTEQMTACSGTNLGEIQITKDDLDIATLHFYLVVQRDVLAGGVKSASDIHDLEEQISAIVTEVVGEDYYNKEEVDEKIAEIPTFDPTNYYDKSDVDALLDDKADVSDLPDMSNYYDKSETEALLSNKADKTVVDSIKLLPTVKSASGSVATFDTDLINNLIECKCDIMYSQASGTPTPADPLLITVYTSLNLSHSDDDISNPTITNIPFGQTVAKGMLNIITGVLTITHGYTYLSTSDTWNYSSAWSRTNTNVFFTTQMFPNIKFPNFDYQSIAACSHLGVGSRNEVYSADTNMLGLSGNTTSGQLTVRIDKTVAADLTEFIQWITDNQVYYSYELVTPTVLQLTPIEVTQLLNENNIWCDTNGDTSVKYSLTIGKAIS